MPDQQHLINVKQKLAEKYEHLSRIAGSKPRRKKLANRARKYRRQAAQLALSAER